MDLKKLIYFATVAECGSFTKAAAQLHIAQPALSRQISLLEKEFGLSLLVRMDRHIKPTDAGAVLLRHARQLIQGFERARNEMQSRGTWPKGRVVFGAPPSLGTVIVPKIVERLGAELPDVEFKVREGTGLFLKHSIIDAEIDLALIAEEPGARAIDGETLAHEDIVLIGRPELLQRIKGQHSRLPSDVPVMLSQQTNALVTQTLVEEGIDLSAALEIDALHAIKAVTLEGRGVALMPIGVFHDELRTGLLSATRIRRLKLSRPIVLAYSALRTPSLAVEAMARILREEVKALALARTFSLHKATGDGAARFKPAAAVSSGAPKQPADTVYARGV